MVPYLVITAYRPITVAADIRVTNHNSGIQFCIAGRPHVAGNEHNYDKHSSTFSHVSRIMTRLQQRRPFQPHTRVSRNTDTGPHAEHSSIPATTTRSATQPTFISVPSFAYQASNGARVTAIAHWTDPPGCGTHPSINSLSLESLQQLTVSTTGAQRRHLIASNSGDTSEAAATH